MFIHPVIFREEINIEKEVNTQNIEYDQDLAFDKPIDLNIDIENNTRKENLKKYNYVFTTGGIGPTHDDITAESISKAFKIKYEINRKAFKILEKYYSKRDFNTPRQKMSKMPRGSKLIYNPSSAAPGFKIKNIFVLKYMTVMVFHFINFQLSFLTNNHTL